MRNRSFNRSFPTHHRNSRHDRMFFLSKFGVFAVFALVIGMLGFGGFQAIAVTNSHTSCTVVDKDRTRDSEGNSDMRIYAEGCDGASKSQVFQVSDNWFAGQFASANTYAEIEVGKTYDFETRGTRIPILSFFENIVEATETTK